MKPAVVFGTVLVSSCVSGCLLSFIWGTDSTTTVLWAIAASYMVFFSMIIVGDVSK